MLRFLRVALVFFLCFVIFIPPTAYSRSAEEARITLGQMNIPYTTESFIKAVEQGDIIVVKLFLEAGMKSTEEKDKYGFTALVWAAGKGNTEIVKLLLSKGADVNAKDKAVYGGTALMAAANRGHTEIVKLLLSKGADVNAKDEAGGTALMAAAGNGNTEIVNLLLSKGADVNAKDKNGYTALMAATIRGHTEILKLFKDAGADLEGLIITRFKLNRVGLPYPYNNRSFNADVEVSAMGVTVKPIEHSDIVGKTNQFTYLWSNISEITMPEKFQDKGYIIKLQFRSEQIFRERTSRLDIDLREKEIQLSSEYEPDITKAYETITSTQNKWLENYKEMERNLGP